MNTEWYIRLIPSDTTIYVHYYPLILCDTARLFNVELKIWSGVWMRPIEIISPARWSCRPGHQPMYNIHNDILHLGPLTGVLPSDTAPQYLFTYCHGHYLSIYYHYTYIACMDCCISHHAMWYGWEVAIHAGFPKKFPKKSKNNAHLHHSIT